MDKPYSYLTNAQLKQMLIRLAKKLKVDDWVFDLIDEAFENKKWDPVNDYDGCTLVQDCYHPSLACFIHDYLWKCGFGGLLSDKIYKYIMNLEGMHKYRITRRWLAVRFVWLILYKWKHLFNKNIENPYTSKALTRYMILNSK